MVNVKIDGVEVQVEPNATIIEAAEKLEYIFLLFAMKRY